MTIEIHDAELEAFLQQQLASGKFSSVEDMLLHTFRNARPESAGLLDEERKTKAAAAADSIRELRQGVTLNRPAGMSLREYAHIGHKY